jgi:hypothetical protein
MSEKHEKKYLYESAPKPVKLTNQEKIKIESIINGTIEKNDKLKEDVARINIKAGCIYFYFWSEDGKKFMVSYILIVEMILNGKNGKNN